MISFTKIFLAALPIVTMFGASVAAPLEAVKQTQSNAHSLQKRFAGHATYYQTGQGACGGFNNPGDFIVALNSAQYGGGYPGPQCFKSLVISHGGKQATAQVVDECPTCGFGDLDFSQGLFEFFEPTSVGRFEMTWDWAGSVPSPSPEPTTPKPTPTPTSQEPTTTSTPQSTSTASSASLSSLTSSLLSSSSGSASAATESSISGSSTSTGVLGQATPPTGVKGVDGTAKLASGSNIDSINILLSQLGQMVLSGASLK